MIFRIPCQLSKWLSESIHCSFQTPRSVKPPFSSPFSTTTPLDGKKPKRPRRSHWEDAYATKQAKLRKEAHNARKAVLKQQRAEAEGNPIRGVTTDFVRSLDVIVPQTLQLDSTDDSSSRVDVSTSFKSSLVPPTPERLNHFLTRSELEESLALSKFLSKPKFSSNRTNVDPEEEAKSLEIHELQHIHASEALNRILSMTHADSRHVTLTNKQRIIDLFGRHNTDQHLKPKAPSSVPRGPRPNGGVTPRAGPDVGSSEVQIGILTAKIRVLADRLESEGRQDKVNKRNLRVLLHRRQKLLRYMFRRERGSGRWQHMVENLGLTEPTWRGQIEVR